MEINHPYDARDRLLRITHPDGVQIAYEYDAAGNRTRMTTAQQDIAYTYDALNRLETVVQGGRTTTYAYTAVGSRRRITLPTGARTDYTYDVRNRLQTLAHTNASGSTLLHQTYTVDASGLRTQLVEYGLNISATRTVVYGYDPLKRLVREDVSDSTRGNRVSQWTYDAVGNRQSETRTKAGVSITTTYAYDANDRLQGEASSDGTTVAYEYDANGSLTGKQDAQGTSVYGYDGDRRLVDAITPNAGMSYRYDANGIRQSQTVNGVTTRFVVDPTAQYAQVLEERSSTGNVLYLLGDDRIARTQGGTTHYLHTDGLGSTRLLTDGTTVATDRWWYEAFGEVESSTGTSGNAFLFAGEQLDPNLGHYYLRARYMDPGNGRFTQMDSFSGFSTDPLSLHKYVYGNGSPINGRDPSGYVTLLETSANTQITSLLKTSTRIAIFSVNAYDKVDAAITLIQLGQGGLNAMELMRQFVKQNGDIDDPSFVNAMRGIDDAAVVLSRNFAWIVSEMAADPKKDQKMLAFFRGRKNNLLVYGPTPEGRGIPWFSPGTRVHLGKIVLSKGGSRDIELELGRASGQGGRMIGVGHSHGSQKTQGQQWWRMDWHSTLGHGAGSNDLVDGAYHFHTRTAG